MYFQTKEILLKISSTGVLCSCLIVVPKEKNRNQLILHINSHINNRKIFAVSDANNRERTY